MITFLISTKFFVSPQSFPHSVINVQVATLRGLTSFFFTVYCVSFFSFLFHNKQLVKYCCFFCSFFAEAHNRLFWPIFLSTTLDDLKVKFGYIGESHENFMSKYTQEV